MGKLLSVGMDVFFVKGQAARTAHHHWRKFRPGESAQACGQPGWWNGIGSALPGTPKPSILPEGAHPEQAQLWLSTGMRKSDFQKPGSPQ